MAKDNIVRVAWPKERYAVFHRWLIVQTVAFGLDEDPDVATHIDMLANALERKAAEMEAGLDRRVIRRKTSLQTFIVVFKSRYIQFTDSEYFGDIGPAELSVVGNFVQTLERECVSVDEYLAWFFEEYLPDNEDMVPPSIKLPPARYVWQRFRYLHLDEIKSRKRMRAQSQEEIELFNKARELYRRTQDREVLDAMKRCRNNEMPFDDFRRLVAARESAE